MKLGLKLWSTNDFYIEEAIRLYKDGFYDYIELFSVPGSFEDTISWWTSLLKNYNIEFLIHAPHSAANLNFSKRECLKQNTVLRDEALHFADKLDSRYVIFHPGVDGDIEETAFQIRKLYDSRMIVENKPYLALVDDLVCVGSSPAEIRYLLYECNIGFCLDFGHATYAANKMNVNPMDIISEFNNLSPAVYHLMDGQYDGIYDMHKHLGQGNLPLNKYLMNINDNSYITIETDKNSIENLKDFEDDVIFLRKLL